MPKRKKTFSRIYFWLAVILFVFVGVMTWSYVSFKAVPVEINEISEASTTSTFGFPSDCTQWFDGCNTCSRSGDKMICTKISCKKPSTPKCLSNCIPNPCPPGAACKLPPLPDGQSYCSTPSPLPTSLPSGCYYIATHCVKEPCEEILVCNSPTPYPSAIPSSTPTPPEEPDSVQLTIFHASEPCGIANYRSYQFSCSNGVKNNLNDTCHSLNDAMLQAKKICHTQTVEN